MCAVLFMEMSQIYCIRVIITEKSVLFHNLVSWDKNKVPNLVHWNHKTKITKLVLSKDNKILYSYAFDLTLIAFDLVEKKTM